MGGYFSGRRDGRPTADASRRIDIAWMIRKGWAVPGSLHYGVLTWTRGDQPSGSINYQADMRDPDAASLVLSYTRGEGNDQESVRQVVRLTYTIPNYGGQRWWMICPFRGNRCGKLYMPLNGDRFAGRKAWRLGYHCQRITERDRPFEALSRLQKKLGCPQGYEMPICRPKGMWHRTYERHLQRYWELDDECAYEMALVAARVMGFSKVV